MPERLRRALAASLALHLALLGVAGWLVGTRTGQAARSGQPDARASLDLRLVESLPVEPSEVVAAASPHRAGLRDPGRDAPAGSSDDGRAAPGVSRSSAAGAASPAADVTRVAPLGSIAPPAASPALASNVFRPGAEAARSVAPDDDIVDAGRYRMALVFAMRRVAGAASGVATSADAAERVRVVMSVALDASGALASVEVLRSGGSAAVDERAKALVTEAHAASPVPTRLRGTPMRFEVAVDVARSAGASSI